MNRTILLELIKESFNKRRSLPIEITKIIESDDEASAAINQSFDHVERVFMLKNLLTYEAEDDEDYLFYLRSAFDDSTYYASLAIPILRQLQESNRECNDSYISLQKSNVININKISKYICNSEKDIKNITPKILDIINELSSLEESYNSIKSFKDLMIWVEKTLECYAYVVILGGIVRRI